MCAEGQAMCVTSWESTNLQTLGDARGRSEITKERARENRNAKIERTPCTAVQLSRHDRVLRRSMAALRWPSPSVPCGHIVFAKRLTRLPTWRVRYHSSKGTPGQRPPGVEIFGNGKPGECIP